MEKVGLVLQGGGMRGIYTSGVLDYFMEQGLYIPYVIAVSAGACNGAAYLARQPGLGKTMHTKYIRDSRYFHAWNLVKRRPLLGMDFIFDELLQRVEPFALDRFWAAEEEFVVVATDCATGEAVYFTKNECDNLFQVIRASCSLPFVSPKVNINGRQLWDGGITHPIPLQKSLNDGNERHVVILTSSQSPGWVTRNMWRVERLFAGGSQIGQALIRHFRVFLEATQQVRQLQQEGKAFVIAPPTGTYMRGFERRQEKLLRYYTLGYEDARACFSDLLDWLGKGKQQDTGRAE
ncbi:patatin-like phospholipase family protein [Brevibacillus sp. SAFN-007a]|uniref:patatin-like phospholipase family protein n=1 Tax=Brevibacillus sp. SAFN-007a TaxID=3436862 RepID=UPI003F7F6215